MDELINEMKEYLPKLIKGVRDIAQYFHSNKYDEGLKLLEQAIEGINWVTNVYSVLIIQDTQNIQELNKALNNTNIALSSNDFIMVGDIFEYETSNILEKMYIGIIDMKIS